MNWLVGDNNKKACQVSGAYIGVNNVAKRVKHAYVGVDGVAKLFFNAEPVLIFEQSTPGKYNVSATPGMYDIVLIAGGASGLTMSSSGKGFRFQGGCGGTLRVVVLVRKSCTITVTVGAGGVKISGAMSAGNDSRVDGIVDAVLIAGGGKTDIDASSSLGGSIGDNQVSGTAIHSVAINNPTAIRGGGQSYTIKTGGMIPAWRVEYEKLNTNWPADTSRGKGGGPNAAGENGYVRIIKI